jgi:phenylpyruvate tautomerase PptA (4-oxalocrotonate tautomerase family)
MGAAVHRALNECLDAPERDHFQVITEHQRAHLIYDRAYLGVERSDRVVFVQVFLSTGRSTEQKKAFFARAAQLMVEGARMRREDVTIVVMENTREDWSFGNGVAQYLTMPRDRWK